MFDAIKPVFTATAAARGGRNGHAEAADGAKDVAATTDVSISPREEGGFGVAVKRYARPRPSRPPR